MRKHGYLAFMLLFIIVASSCNGVLFRNPQHDVEQLLSRKLTQDEAELMKLILCSSAGISITATDAEYHKALKDMSPLTYKEAIESAAKMIQSKPLMTLYKTGKLTEKTIKALIQTMKEAIKNVGDYIDQKAMEYDLSQ